MMANYKWSTLTDFVTNGKLPQASTGDIIEFLGYSAKGDGGGAQWRKTGNTGTASQTPSDLIDGLIRDARGDEWAIVVDGGNSTKQFGFVSSSTVEQSDMLNAATKACQGSSLRFDEGEYVAQNVKLYSNSSYYCDTYPDTNASGGYEAGAAFYQTAGGTNPIFVSESWIDNLSSVTDHMTLKNVALDRGTLSPVSGNLMDLFIDNSELSNIVLTRGYGDAIALHTENSDASYESPCYGVSLDTIIIRQCAGNGIGIYKPTVNDYGYRDIKLSNIRCGFCDGYGVYSPSSVGFRMSTSILWANASGNVYLGEFSGGHFSDTQLELDNVSASSGDWYSLYIQSGDWSDSVSGIQFVTSQSTDPGANIYHMGISVPPSRQDTASVAVTGNAFGNFGGLTVSAIKLVESTIPLTNVKISGSSYGPDVTVDHDLRYDEYNSPQSFTPSVTFATAGDLAVTYNTRECNYTISGSKMYVSIYLDFSVTHSTASGNFRITGLPHALKSSIPMQGLPLSLYRNIDIPATSSDLNVVGYPGTFFEVASSIDAATQSTLGPSNFPSGATNYRIVASGEVLIE